MPVAVSGFKKRKRNKILTKKHKLFNFSKLGRFFKNPEIPNSARSFSQCGEDIIIKFLAHHVLHIKDIIYLDLGSNHPTHLNNTYLFYVEGCYGVSVDANQVFIKMYHDLRPRDKFIHCGVGNKSGELTFYEMEPDSLSTFSLETAMNYTKNALYWTKK